jgi:putative periplasmic solute-binding protein
MRIGIVEYINALPFHLPYKIGELKTPHSLEYAIPSLLNYRLRTGVLDAALTSSSEYLDGPYSHMPRFCIGSQKEILSVNLYLRGELNGARIGLTHHSATSIALLKVLCHHFWKVKPRFVPLVKGGEYDGMLMIGDDALKHMTIPDCRTIDLAASWYEATGLPFVFAVIAARDGKGICEEVFEAALSWSVENRPRLIDAACDQSKLPKALIDRYYNLCTYRLGEKEILGLKLFEKLRNCVSEVVS